MHRVARGAHGTHDHVRVPNEVLGARVQHHVSSKDQRTLEVSGQERVVHHNEDIFVDCLNSRGDSSQISDLECRIDGSLAPDQDSIASALLAV